MKAIRRKYIVDRKFQWTVVGYTLCISMLTTLLHYTISRLEVYGPLPMGKMLAFFGIFYLLVTWIAILFSNRLAGPLYRLRRFLKDAAVSGTAQKIFFRTHDYYSELNQAYNEFVDKLASKRNDQGFTLIEIMLVVAIVGTLTAVTVSSFMNRPRDASQMKNEMTKLKGLLVSARNAAVNKNQCAFVTVETPQRVALRTYAIANPCTTDPLPAVDMEVIEQFGATTAITQFSSGQTLVFRPNGGTTFPGTVNISLSFAGGMTNQLLIYPVIGQVRQL